MRFQTLEMDANTTHHSMISYILKITHFSKLFVSFPASLCGFDWFNRYLLLKEKRLQDKSKLDHISIRCLWLPEPQATTNFARYAPASCRHWDSCALLFCAVTTLSLLRVLHIIQTTLLAYAPLWAIMTFE